MSGERPIDGVRRMLSVLLPSPDMPFMERRSMVAAFEHAFETPAGLSIEAGLLGGVTAEWIVPGASAPVLPGGASASGVPGDTPASAAPERGGAAPVLMHLHGGGYVLGTPASSRPLTTALALKSGLRVVSIDYRLAPENPFPAAVDDAVAAYRALLEDGTAPVAIGGESAGGGLAIAVLTALRDAGLALPACAFAISPWVDMACSAASFDTRGSFDPMLTRRALREMAEAYLRGTDEKHPLASPLHGDLAGLPPLLIHVGGDEVLLDDAHGLQAAATAAGVRSTLAQWPDMIHVWHMFHAALPEGGQAIDEIVAFVKGSAGWAG
ncbi:MAG: alpha/beta hydrolase [Alphaproteobacteria bacterium]|nr:alpha/beta hydrolase [Alphaproteobacteria bacterium]